MSYTAEQEAQLTAWGCPRPVDPSQQLMSFPPQPVYLPRQPHDVLAWLGAVYAADVELHCSGGVSWRATLFGCSASKWHPDPYAATFALAQAVMEAK